ncbi:MAG: poly-gamma-glutamate hydrolase family protein [Mycolicibacterium neoaurum]|uniref:poly-gamma-glutamate hydrolase family protein n=1 Tax=Mycolicibacterium TaxID=1866885 RepID=UPI002FF90EAC
MADHLYFAYGSNLCTDQMAARCPDARGPVRAMLADHDWLINERGVATIEPAAGAEVHGVVWRISDADLAVLDRAEGIPVRYRRDRATVRTDDGPRDAWIYIDHRIEPGAPRPGYLERVIAGASHHGLPQRWLDFLDRWHPANWPRALAPSEKPGPRTLTELLSDPLISEYSILRGPFAFLAIHGGGLERMTDVIAERAAELAGASVYVVRHPPDYPHHLSSAAYRAAESERLAEFLDHAEHVVSLHGYGRVGRSNELLAGGGNRELAGHVAAHLDIPGHRVITDLDAIPRELRGLHPDNPVNRTRGGGVQLELAPRVRGISPRSGPLGEDGLSRPTRALIAGLVSAARAWPRI